MEKNSKPISDSDQCYNCINYLGDLRCIAFESGIPEKILSGEVRHDKPLPEQNNDIIFQSIDEIVP
jgi:hypothetical protein